MYAPYQGNKRQSSSKGKICFGFSRDGFCKYGEQCKFAHTGHSKPINNFSQYRPRSNNQNMQAREKICFNFSKSGNCKYSDRCKYKHVTQQNTHESHHFLEEIRTVVKCMKEFLESQRQYPLQVPNFNSQFVPTVAQIHPVWPVATQYYVKGQI